jgi:uncharacterized phiE125 gp8 family phage protein
MTLAPVRTSDPAKPVLSINEVKDHLNISTESKDAEVSALIQAATNRLEGYRGSLDGYCLITQTWQQDYGMFGTRGYRFLDHASDVLRLPLRPVQAVSSVTYFDGTNASQTLSTDVYGVYTDATGTYLAEKPDQQWPTTYTRRDAVTVTFTVGFGDDSSDIPEDLRLAMKQMIAHWFENRETMLVSESGRSAVLPIPMTAEDILASYRVGVF